MVCHAGFKWQRRTSAALRFIHEQSDNAARTKCCAWYIRNAQFLARFSNICDNFTYPRKYSLIAQTILIHNWTKPIINWTRGFTACRHVVSHHKVVTRRPMAQRSSYYVRSIWSGTPLDETEFINEIFGINLIQFACVIVNISLVEIQIQAN